MTAQTQYDFDYLVIGAGSGGVRTSRVAASLGARVAVVEEGALGGTCVNVGCVPKKLLSHAAHFEGAMHEAAGFGWSVDGARFDWATLIANKNAEIHRLNGVYDKLLANAGVQLITGRASLVDAHTVQVGERRVSARHIVIATGGHPNLPQIPGIEHAITSDQAFFLPELPQRAVVVGGGYIAVEFASIFNGLGAKTQLVYRGAQLLRHFDADLGSMLAERMAQNGVQLQLQSDITSIEKRADGLHLQLTNGQSLIADCVLYATGRVPKTEGLGLEAAGVKVNAKGAIEVDKHFATNVPSIHAIGDVVDRLALTPVALAEGTVLAHHLFGASDKPVPDYELVPTAVFSHPNVGTVGLSEEQARKRWGAVQIFKSKFRPLTNRLTTEAENILLKLVVATDSRKVVGVHMVGPEAGEMIQGFAVALQCGATKEQFDATLGIHPTIAEEFVTMREPVSS